MDNADESIKRNGRVVSDVLEDELHGIFPEIIEEQRKLARISRVKG